MTVASTWRVSSRKSSDDVGASTTSNTWKAVALLVARGELELEWELEVELEVELEWELEPRSRRHSAFTCTYTRKCVADTSSQVDHDAFSSAAVSTPAATREW